jgi:hypothetical protein
MHHHTLLANLLQPNPRNIRLQAGTCLQNAHRWLMQGRYSQSISTSFS